MLHILIALIISTLTVFALIRYEHLHQHISFDPATGEPQKVHSKNVSRIGGLGICLGASISIFIQSIMNAQFLSITYWFLPIMILVFMTGFAEDITKKIAPAFRMLILTFLSLIAIYFGNLEIHSIDMIGFDINLTALSISILFTVFAITGLINAYNIIDGFNGLSSMTSIIALLSISYVAFKSGDIVLTKICLISIAAIIGFFVWNYPYGHIFLGDGGAYFIGFQVAALSILLVNRNDSVASWFPILINAYPIYETLFTIWRRKFIMKNNATSSDSIHFHSLIYRRVLSSKFTNKENKLLIRNSITSPYLWLLSSMGSLPAMLFYDNSLVLQILFSIFCLTYTIIYWSIVRFKTPKWLSNIPRKL